MPRFTTVSSNQSTSNVPQPSSLNSSPSFVALVHHHPPPPPSNTILVDISEGSSNSEQSSDSYDSADDDKFLDGPRKACPQCSDEDLEDAASSVASLLDYNIFEGLVSRGGGTDEDAIRSPTEAFIPDGGMVACEQKRKEFMDYLRRTGFLGAISKLLLSVWSADPYPDEEVAIEYFARCLGYKLTIHDDLAENARFANIMKARIRKLEAENEMMRTHLDNYITTETPIEIVDPATFPPIHYQKHGKPKAKHLSTPKKSPLAFELTNSDRDT